MKPNPVETYEWWEFAGGGRKSVSIAVKIIDNYDADEPHCRDVTTIVVPALKKRWKVKAVFLHAAICEKIAPECAKLISDKIDTQVNFLKRKTNICQPKAKLIMDGIRIL